MLQTCLHN